MKLPSLKIFSAILFPVLVVMILLFCWRDTLAAQDSIAALFLVSLQAGIRYTYVDNTPATQSVLAS